MLDESLGGTVHVVKMAGERSSFVCICDRTGTVVYMFADEQAKKLRDLLTKATE